MAATDNTLEGMNAVLKEIETHAKRLAVEARGGAVNATAPLLAQELAETIMPLLRDFAALAFDEVLSIRQYLHDEVEPALLDGGAPEDSGLYPDDAEMITKQLLGYRNLLGEMLASVSDDKKPQVAAAIGEVDVALARVGEITLDEEEEDDGGEGDEDDDPDDDDEEDGDEDEEAAAAAPKQ